MSKKKPIFKKWWFWVVIVVLVIGVGGNTGGSKKDVSNSNSEANEFAATEKEVDKNTEICKDEENNDAEEIIDDDTEICKDEENNDTEESLDVIKEAINEAIDKLDLEQKNAIKSAENYLSFSAFSREGLIQQLSSDYGDGYSKEDAEFAVDYLEKNDLVDWKEQAYRAAENYLSVSPFSKKGLIDQLSSEYGDKYTKDEAEYGVNLLESNGEVDWKEQAAKAAQNYLDITAFSKNELIEQLSSEYGDKYTKEEAQYGAEAAGF